MTIDAMTMSADHIHHYSQLEQVCEQMLSAARGGDWNRVARIEDDTHALIAYLREHGEDGLAHDERLEKFRILRNILQIDAEIRHLSHPWARVVDEMLAGQASRRLSAGCTGL